MHFKHQNSIPYNPSTNTFNDEWIPLFNNTYSDTSNPLSLFQNDLKFAHLINPVTKEWRELLLNILFPSACLPIIKSIHIPIADCQDRLVWGFSLLFFMAIDGAWRKDSRAAAAWVIRDDSGILRISG